MTRPVHFEILADDPEKISAFYRDLFGWEVTAWNGPQSYWMVKTGASEQPGIDGGIMHRHFPQPVINTLYVDSLDDMIARIEAAGGKKIHGPDKVEGVGMHVYCADPEGNMFGMMEAE